MRHESCHRIQHHLRLRTRLYHLTETTSIGCGLVWTPGARLTRGCPASPNYVPGPEEPEQALLGLNIVFILYVLLLFCFGVDVIKKTIDYQVFDVVVEFHRSIEVKDPQAPPSPNYVPGPEYPEYLAPADDEIIVEDQPYADYASPVALSPGYVADLDPEEDSKDGPVDYLTDGSDDDDDDDSFDDDEEEEEASEKDEHLAPTDSIVAPVVDPVPSFKETEPFETNESATTPPPPPPADHTTPLGARISI
nr:hypothetical protein [Tanacetum cinerariifolium]